MTCPLIELGDHLAPLLAGLEPVAPLRLPLREALGLIAAVDVVAPAAMPSAAVALRSGYAVNALDCAGASPQSPAPLPSPPKLLSVGDVLPPGCDAILDRASLQTGRFGPEVFETVEPGAWVRLAGQDLAAGQPIVAAGRRITSEQVLAVAMAGIDTLMVRRPVVRIDWDDSPERDWLAGRTKATGALLAEAGDPADILLHIVDEERPRLALAPGAAGWAEQKDRIISIALPARFDALFGAWCALVLPVLAGLSAAEILANPSILKRKIASAVGWTEVALLRLDGHAAHPLAVGDAHLGGIASADAFAILEPESEGAPAGDTVLAISLDRPF